jgi:DNA primase
MALPPSFLDEIRARTPMHGLVSRRVQLKKSGKNWTGCCPFHTEKSPSFYVYDDGFHCFGCGAHGDAITFVMQTQGSSFIDAVESLAAEAGLEVPKQSPRAAEIEQERMGLHDVLEAAQAEFVRLLRTPAGAQGLAYLRGRGLSEATIERFGLGWSGDGRGSLTAALGAQGIDPARLEEAGLLRPQEDGNPARELYWGRVTFPIRDRRGRTISFGGRTLGDAKPKYINGPETRLFLKKQTLYALDLAREGVRKSPLVVVEGYMDVIALHQAGFGAAVAPLGTALTEEQLAALWRLSPVPTLCFDGDAAGARAAARAAELCLPLITPEQSLRLATLPAGQDPDDLVRHHGTAGFQAVLDSARPLVDALFDVLREGGGETPEARAGFRARLDAAAARIADKGLSQEYRNALREKFFTSRKPFGKGGAKGVVPRSQPIVRRPPDTGAVQNERARCLTAILLRHPNLVHDVEEAWSGLELSMSLSRLRDAMLHTVDVSALDSEALVAHLNASGLSDDVAFVLSATMPLPPSARVEAMPAEAEGEWWHLFGLMRGLSRLDEEVAEAARAYADQQTEAAQRRLVGLVNARLELVAIDIDE